MPTLIVENTGVDHLYENGVPIAEVSVIIADIIEYVARISSLSAQTDPFFNKHSSIQKSLVELHGEGTRIFKDFLQFAATDILPVFQSMQRWMTAFTDSEGDPIVMYEYDSIDNPGLIIYRWQIMDTRLDDSKQNYTSDTLVDIVNDLNIVRNVQRYLIEALRDYVLLEFYKTIGHERKRNEYFRSYNQNRSYVAFWAKSDLSLQTPRNG